MTMTLNLQSKVARVVEVLTECSGDEATTASRQICKDPDAVIILGAACGLSAGAVAKGATATKAAAAVQAWPLAVTSAAISGVGVLAAKRFCGAMVKHGMSGLTLQRERDIMSDAIGVGK